MADLNVLLEAWAAELAQALAMMTGQQFRVASPSHRPGAGDADLWWYQPLSLAPGAVLAVGAAPQVWSALGTRALQGAGIETVEESEARSTWLEIVQQSLSGAARSAAVKLRKPVECGTGEEHAASPSGSRYFSATIVAPDGVGFGIEVAASGELVLSLSEKVPPAAAAEITEARSSAPTQEIQLASRTMDVLRDVHLPVSISFGTAQLPLRDVLKLSSGSVVELNRQPEEPVDVIVNDHVIARGEVVIVDGNYAVRIQEIVSRQQRLGLSDSVVRR
jgi:flagellar motor switch protein FliN/FliY